MKVQTRFTDFVKSSYLAIVIALLGAVAFILAVLVAWPALAYLAAKLFG